MIDDSRNGGSLIAEQKYSWISPEQYKYLKMQRNSLRFCFSFSGNSARFQNNNKVLCLHY